MSPDQPSGSERGPPVDSLRSDFQALVERSGCLDVTRAAVTVPP
jgi:hypothetical protein